MQLPPESSVGDPKSFGYSTARERWPIIIEDGILDIQQQSQKTSANFESGMQIVQRLKDLLHAIHSNKVVEPATADEISLNHTLAKYNKELERVREKGEVTWLNGPWLFLECYLYQKINIFFITSPDPFWHEYDIFNNLKNATFQKSEKGVVELCKRYEHLISDVSSKTDNETLRLLFHEFADISLWGNAVDLSLLAGSVTLDDIQSVQGEEVRKQNEKKVLVKDLDIAWEHLRNSKKERADIVLDNSGFELFVDLVFALFLLDSGIVKQVVLHAKSIPWFVSDVIPKDFKILLDELVSPSFFKISQKSSTDSAALNAIHARLVNFNKEGQIKIKTHPYWTTYDSFPSIIKEDSLYGDLLKSDLIIFKGDLNYRKLTSDLHWKKTTPFTTAILDLADSKLPILALRTCKADVVVGLEEGVDEKVSAEYTTTGKDGHFWPASGKWAVISFSKGYKQ